MLPNSTFWMASDWFYQSIPLVQGKNKGLILFDIRVLVGNGMMKPDDRERSSCSRLEVGGRILPGTYRAGEYFSSGSIIGMKHWVIDPTWVNSVYSMLRYWKI